MLGIIAKSLKTGIVTEANPFGARASFGFPVIDFSRCTACDECARSCPTGAIQTATARRRSEDALPVVRGLHPVPRVRRPACPEQAVSVSSESRWPHTVVSNSRRPRRSRSIPPRAGARSARWRSQPGSAWPNRAARLRERITRATGRSLHVRQVDAGSCNGCELEIAATTNPVYDLERFGIHFVASPRHADVLLVTGPVTRNMEIALRRTYEATPEPRVVVAVGACGCSGGIFGEGTYALSGASTACCRWTSTFPDVRLGRRRFSTACW